MAADRKEYFRNYQREWIKQRRADYFFGKVCIQCGCSENLELDHIHPEIKVHHAIWSWSDDRRQAELVKCQPLCRDCHLKKTNTSLARPLVHGMSGYRRGCRCDVCKFAQYTRRKEQRSKQRELGLPVT